VCQGDTTEHYAFWANTDQDERHMWQQFVDQVQQYPDNAEDSIRSAQATSPLVKQ